MLIRSSLRFSIHVSIYASERKNSKERRRKITIIILLSNKFSVDKSNIKMDCQKSGGVEWKAREFSTPHCQLLRQRVEMFSWITHDSGGLAYIIKMVF